MARIHVGLDQKIFIGLDTSSTAVGYAVSIDARVIASGTLFPDGVKSSKSKLQPKAVDFTWLARILALEIKLRDLLHEVATQTAVPYQQMIVAIESPALTVKSKNAVRCTFGIFAVVLRMLLEIGFTHTHIHADYPPAHVKKAIASNGAAKKPIVADYVRDHFKLPEIYQFASDDESDALAVLGTLLLSHHFYFADFSFKKEL